MGVEAELGVGVVVSVGVGGGVGRLEERAVVWSCAPFWSNGSVIYQSHSKVLSNGLQVGQLDGLS